MLSTMHGLSQSQPHAKGGKVRRFAPGGLVPSWQELAKQNQEQQYQPQLENIAQNLQTYKAPYDPLKNWSAHVGAELLANPSGSGLAAIGRGSKAAIDTRERFEQHGYDQSRADQTQAANLYYKMGESLKKQKQFLATLGETQRHHRMTEALAARQFLHAENVFIHVSSVAWL